MAVAGSDRQVDIKSSYQKVKGINCRRTVDPKRSLFRLSAESILQPTALVHEAWLKLAGEPPISMASRRQFYALASRMMRGILVEHVRRGQTTKRGGSQIEIPLSEANAAEQPRCVDFPVLDQAMTRLDEIRLRYQEIIELRFMAGLTIEETAELLDVSHATIEREWNFARLWLRRELGQTGETQ